MAGEDEHTAVVYSIFRMEGANISIYADHDQVTEGGGLPGEERHARAPGSTQHHQPPKDANIGPEGRKSNRIEEFTKKRKTGEITGQKMKITVKYMREKRRKRWERDYAWLENDLDRLIDSCDVNPEDLQDFSLPMVLIGSDVASLYPSLDAEKVAEIVYNAVLKSDIKWTNIDYVEATRFIALNWSEEKCNKSKLRRVLPVRRSNHGTRPGVRGAGPSGPEVGDQEQWQFRPNIRLRESEKKEIIARVVEISVSVMSAHMCTPLEETFTSRPQAAQ